MSSFKILDYAHPFKQLQLAADLIKEVKEQIWQGVGMQSKINFLQRLLSSPSYDWLRASEHTHYQIVHMAIVLTIILNSNMFHALGRNMITGASDITGTPV